MRKFNVVVTARVNIESDADDPMGWEELACRDFEQVVECASAGDEDPSVHDILETMQFSHEQLGFMGKQAAMAAVYAASKRLRELYAPAVIPPSSDAPPEAAAPN